MGTIVIDPPLPIVTHEEAIASGIFAADDDEALIESLLEVAQQQIDGPNGTLNACFGDQVLEETFCVDDEWTTADLVYQPYIETISDTTSEDGKTRTVRYRAGYIDPADVPAPVRRAVIRMAKAVQSSESNFGAVRSEQVDGVGRIDYQVSETVESMLKGMTESLLAPYRKVQL
jgi:hypothetical protein